MKRGPSGRAVVLVVLLSFGLVTCSSTIFVHVQYDQIGTQLDRLHTLFKQKDRPMLSTQWTSGKQLRTYTTTAGTDETPAAHAKRHAKELAEVQQVFPVDA